MIRFIAMRDWGSCLNSMIIDMKGRTLSMIYFFIAMIEKRKCNELLIIAMKSQISSMKTDTDPYPYAMKNWVLMTRNKMRVAIESGKGMKVKVVKLC